MYKEYHFHDLSDNGNYHQLMADDVEYVKPSKYFEKMIVASVASMNSIFLQRQNPEAPIHLLELNSYANAYQFWTKRLAEIRSTKVSDDWQALLESKSKKEQFRLLKNAQLSSKGLMALLLLAESKGYSFSQYTAEHDRQGLEKEKMPLLAELKDGVVHKVGDTQLSDGEIAQAIRHRKFLNAKFIDRENSWHCFFLTFESIGGEERWKDGQPHYHYISDKFGIPRATVLQELKSRKYRFSPWHLDKVDDD
ncbi:MAG: hypothetical protein EOO10_22845 [Chitinophagaceae bacterium]|nr:MAG: hypothetical protein EOO10_22845 [Chitinophagaceae bacterium]